ncbi:MAG: division/cell wall cluster transcriptional repressor MraZ [Planctomycetales bacterium]|nr:division/cell wall cluster transcriptional repressor MraZ [Planctomycetales bacterium]
MLLTGTFERSFDDKQRIAIPKPLRDALRQVGAESLIVAPGTDGSLALYTEETFAALADRLAVVSPNSQDVRSFSRLLFARAQRVEIDKTGRVRIPAELALWAGIEKTATLVGVRDHMELWDKSRWEAYLAGIEPRFDQIAEQAFEPPAARPTRE